LPVINKLNKTTVSWPTTAEAFKRVTRDNNGGIESVDPYNVTLGLTNFPTVSFNKLVDLEVPMIDLFSSVNDPASSFQQASQALNQIKQVLSDPYFSKHLLVHLQTRLTLAFLFGWVFRKVTGYELKVVHRGQVWATSGLPYVRTELYDTPPIIMNPDSQDIVLVLNIRRQLTTSVDKFVRTWQPPPRVIISYTLEGHQIKSAAHALSLAQEISSKIKNLLDLEMWAADRIHLFTAMPAALATLIGYHLNAIRPIKIYFLDESRSRFQIGGTITNQT
jgi:hypothetical protein